MTSKLVLQNTSKAIINYLINSLDSTEDKLSVIENLKEFLDHQTIQTMKGDSIFDRCQYCGEKDLLKRCEYCGVVYCTKLCTAKHDSKGCLQSALDTILET